MWFFLNRLYLPGKFPSKWIAIRNGLSKLQEWRGDPTRSATDREALTKKIQATTAEAIGEIYKDMGLEPIYEAEAKQKIKELRALTSVAMDLTCIHRQREPASIDGIYDMNRTIREE